MRPARAWLLLGLLSVVVLLGLALTKLFEKEPRRVPVLHARGVTLQSKVDSAIAQAQRAYPHFVVEIRGLGSEGLLLEVGWTKPDIAEGDYVAEVRRRAEDQREATLNIFQTVARAHPQMKHFGAFEDRMLVPIWSRRQILSVNPQELRDFTAYSTFQINAETKEGYAVISGGLSQPSLLSTGAFSRDE